MDQLTRDDPLVTEMHQFMKDCHAEASTACPAQVSPVGALNFLVEGGSLDAAKTMYRQHMRWRYDFCVDQCTARHLCVPAVHRGVITLTGNKDKVGRPIVLFRSGRHDPNGNFLELVRAVAYIMEVSRSGNSSDGGRPFRCLTSPAALQCAMAEMDPVHGSLESNSVTVINDYTGFTMKNSDKDGLRLLLDVARVNYPRRCGAFIAARAPTLLNLLWKVVRPWLSDEIKRVVHISNGTDYVQSAVASDQLPLELGGQATLSDTAFLERRAAVEGCTLLAPDDALDVAELTPSSVQGRAPFVVRVGDYSAPATAQRARLTGQLKKRGFHNTNYKKFFCTLGDGLLLYYASSKDKTFAGFIALDSACSLANDVQSAKKFDLLTPCRTYHFEVCNNDRQAWLDAIGAELHQ